MDFTQVGVFTILCAKAHQHVAGQENAAAVIRRFGPDARPSINQEPFHAAAVIRRGTGMTRVRRQRFVPARKRLRTTAD